MDIKKRFIIMTPRISNENLKISVVNISIALENINAKNISSLLLLTKNNLLMFAGFHTVRCPIAKGTMTNNMLSNYKEIEGIIKVDMNHMKYSLSNDCKDYVNEYEINPVLSCGIYSVNLIKNKINNLMVDDATTYDKYFHNLMIIINVN